MPIANNKPSDIAYRQGHKTFIRYLFLSRHFVGRFLRGPRRHRSVRLDRP